MSYPLACRRPRLMKQQPTSLHGPQNMLPWTIGGHTTRGVRLPCYTQQISTIVHRPMESQPPTTSRTINICWSSGRPSSPREPSGLPCCGPTRSQLHSKFTICTTRMEEFYHYFCSVEICHKKFTRHSDIRTHCKTKCPVIWTSQSANA